VVFLRDPQGHVREAVDEVAKRLDLGVAERAVAEDLTAFRDRQHNTLGPVVNIR
jgi:hypothetical protein